MFWRVSLISGFMVLAFAAPALPFGLTIVTQNPNQPVFELVSANPFDRQEVSAPQAYVLTFSRPIKPDRSSIKVTDAFGQRVNGEELQSDGMSITSALPALPPGRYTVKWQARCQCETGEVLAETFHFTVK